MDRATLVVITVSDPAIEPVARALSQRIEAGTVVLHTAGSLGADVLATCRDVGAHVGVMHPLVSFADAKRLPLLEGSTFVIDGDRAAVAAAMRIAKALGARALIANVHGPAYHAAAALAANGAAALAAVAVDIMERKGLSKRDAEKAIGALLRSVGENVERIGVPAALTGPIIRGDAATVRVHREALERIDANARETYDAIGPAILECAIRAGLAPERARAIADELEHGA